MYNVHIQCMYMRQNSLDGKLRVTDLQIIEVFSVLSVVSHDTPSAHECPHGSTIAIQDAMYCNHI